VTKGLFRRCLLIGAAMVGVAVVPALAIVCYVGYFVWVPRYSAVAYFYDTRGFNLRLDLYRTDDDVSRSGRYLSVITASTYHTFNIPGRAWSRDARASVYRIDDNHIAVLSALGNDYKITLTPFAAGPVVADTGEGWQYLGAFEFAFPPGLRPFLQFFDAPQVAECIPMGTDQSDWAGMARAQARHPTCPTIHVRVTPSGYIPLSGATPM
jgi:hypothetical protein